MDVQSYVLSGCAGKKELLKGVFQKKLELIDKDVPRTFEPILDIEPQSKKEKYPDEIIVKNHLLIDSMLGKNHNIVDIKHHLNADGFFEGTKYFQNHKYWGKAKKYIDMIKDVEVKQNKWNYGIAKLQY